MLIKRLLQENGGAKLTTDNQLEIFSQGADLFSRLLADLKRAEQSICVQYFIIRNDPTSRILLQELERQAAAGLEVRLLCDGLGSLRLPHDFFRPLRRTGGQAALYAPLWRQPLRLNNRNHRKICVIDGRIGYIGGFNLGDEYAGRPEEFSAWRDLHLRVAGQAVESLHNCFRHDWRTVTGQTMPERATASPASAGDVAMQIVASGPDTPGQPIKLGMLKLISAARQCICLETPYFIPDDSLLEALRMAALSGVSVQIIIPGQPDHPFVLPAGLSFIGQLLPAGVRCHLYQAGFLHSKLLIIDDAVSTVGSANFDQRSFRLNYEANAFIYDQCVARQLGQIFQTDLARSQEFTLADLERQSNWQRLRSSLARRLAPLL